MKKMAWLLLAVASGLYADGALPLETKGAISKGKSLTKSVTLTYAQLEGSVGGAGAAYRSQSGYLGYQIDANVTLYSDAPYLHSSIAAVFYPFAFSSGEWEGGGLNLSVGLGSFAPIRSSKFYTHSYVPMFIGYQGKQVFIDAGYNVTPIFRQIKSGQYVSVIAEPSFKIGICF